MPTDYLHPYPRSFFWETLLTDEHIIQKYMFHIRRLKPCGTCHYTKGTLLVTMEAQDEQVTPSLIT